MKEIEARTALSQKVTKVFNQFQKVLVKAGTGAGKSKLALDIAASSDEEWTILVPKKPLFDTWKDEMVKWGYESFKERSTIHCYASAHKLEDNTGAEGKNIILDEAHRVTERNWPYIKAMLGTNGKLICLSATVPYKKKDLLEELGIFSQHVVTYTLDSAVDDDLVSDYKIQVIQFPLDDNTKQVEAGRKGAKFLVTEAAGYKFADMRARQAMYTGQSNVIKFAMLNRMRYIYNLPTKLEIARLLLSQIPADKKVIVFAGSIQQANAVGPHRYHSKTNSDDYEAFCEGRLQQLIVVQSVSEGVNIPNVDYAILMQVQSEDLHTIQKIGRALRKTDDPNKCSKVVILEALGTQDSKWVENSIQSFDPTKIDYVSYSQLLAKGLIL